MARVLTIVGEVLALVLAFSFTLGLPFVLFSVRSYQMRRVCRPFRFFHDPRPRLLQCLFWVWDRIDFDGHRYFFTLQDAAVYCWVEQLTDARKAAFKPLEPPIRLASFRPEFRTIIKLAMNSDRIGGLVRCLTDSGAEIRGIALMLLGLSRVRPARRLVTRFKNDPDPAIRRVVARALGRLSCFNDLCSLADDHDPRVRRLASSWSNPPQPYAERLARFVEHGRGEVSERRTCASNMPLYLVAPVVTGKPPKTRGLIRRILEHIRQLVRSNPRGRIV